MKILSYENIAMQPGVEVIAWILFFISLAGCIVFVAWGIVSEWEDKCSIIAGIVGGFLVAALIMASLITSYSNPAKYIYVHIDPEAKYIDYVEKYKFVEKEGDIYKLRVLPEN